MEGETPFESGQMLTMSGQLQLDLPDQQGWDKEEESEANS